GFRCRSGLTRILPSPNVKTACSRRGIVPCARQPSHGEGHMPVTMNKREFITLLGGAAAAWPLAARAQHGEPMRRIGVLMNAAADDPEYQARLAAFLHALQQLGWSDGHNVRIDIRWGAGNPDTMRKYAAELVALAPEVILATTSAATTALQQATRTVPIVFSMVLDPVGGGIVESLARPGGNTTGFMQFEFSLSGKWLELLKQIAPGVTRAAVFRDPSNPTGVGQFAVLQAVAPPLGVEVIRGNVRRRVRDRARCRCVRTLRERRSNRDRRAGVVPSQADRRACRPASVGRGLSLPLLGHRRRLDLLWARSARPVPASGRLRRSHPQGR